MRYIRPCPACNMELRFPLDMGILIITCPNCSHSFRMDPDDPRTFHSGTFDLSPRKTGISFRLPFVDRFSDYLSSSKDIRFLIPLFLLLVLLLNILKIYNTPQSAEEINKENGEFLEDREKYPSPIPDNPPHIDKPSVEI